MKFYEFNGSEYPYYALIGASSALEAVGYYVKEVSGIEEFSELPDECSEEEAISLPKQVAERDQPNEADAAVKALKMNCDSAEPFIILIDGELA